MKALFSEVPVNFTSYN